MQWSEKNYRYTIKTDSDKKKPLNGSQFVLKMYIGLREKRKKTETITNYKNNLQIVK